MHPASVPAPVLVVDDDPVCRMFCHHALATMGREVLLASTADDAIELARLRRPAIIVLDLHLHDIPGHAVAAAVLRSWPHAVTVPEFIAMTGDDAEPRCEHPALARHRFTLKKPFSAGELRECVGAILSGSEPGHPAPGAVACEPDGGLESALRNEWESALDEIDYLISELRWKEASGVLHRLCGAAALTGRKQLAAGAKQVLQAIADGPGGPDMPAAYLEFLWKSAEFIRVPLPGDPGFKPRESTEPFR